MVKAGYTSTPKDVMSWNPSATTCRLTENLKNSNDTATPATDKKTHGGIETVPILTSNDSPTPSSGRVSGSFGRLKAQKVKALVQRTSRIKKERNGDDDEIVIERAPFEKSVKSNYRRESVGSKQIVKSESSKLPQERRNLYADSDFFSRKSFKDLGYSDYMIESLKKQSFVRPSNIQAMAFSPVIDQKSCIIADQSGSGKTLAYLAPLVQRLRQEELEGCSKSLSQAPRVVILAPTAELASQVLSNCRSISKFGVPFKSMVVTGGFRQRTQLENLQQGVDVLIATPGRFMFLIKECFLQLSNLRCAVLDEVDIHFNDEDFEAALQCLINSSPVTTQYLFVTATLPGVIYNKLIEVFPDCEVIMGPGMHRINAGLEEVLVDCSGEDGIEKTPETAFLNKKTALLQLLEGSTVPKTIVFCNKIETCRKVENILKRSDRKEIRMKILPFHAAVTQESRLANMKEFRHTTSREVSQFLVCTDRASRGIDFVRVDHVILFDFPRDPSEYVRRVGRTARGAGGKGKAFIFVVGKQVSLARRIIERNQKGHPLHDVPCTY
ncbi:DEAD-box ATP-dependent RNA helicase [Quillaja saponaria]|uniref:DEAD-box ATP-dependent RNA helicase n=1 Tax=Quillaja saponaria TaxID=32244 RepID=A0AAD7LP72_QUISA|nr:DEAD-box ATP-dependent RNA helicase [Quillaja saponaria]